MTVSVYGPRNDSIFEQYFRMFFIPSSADTVRTASSLGYTHHSEEHEQRSSDFFRLF